MISKERLIEIIKAQKEDILGKEKGITREKHKGFDKDSSLIRVISGIRRCGKSTLLRQLIDKVNNFNYFNFEDPRITDFEVKEVDKLLEAFYETNTSSKHFFFDEIQNLSSWESLARYFHDKKFKIILTGSNASLLTRELGTKLTGRHIQTEMFPFSYKEMLKLKKLKSGKGSFELYLEKGGFPEYLRYDNIDMLRQLFQDILNRDIIVRNKLRMEKVIKDIALYLITNSGKEYSYNNLAKILSIKSPMTVLDIVSYLEDSYLFFSLPKFSYSLKKQIRNPRKVYCIDTGLANALSLSFSKDRGRKLENSVFLHLRRSYKEIFYFKEKNECDFVVKEQENITKVFQVCYKLTEYNKEREIDGLIEAMDEFKLKKGKIITFNQEDSFNVNNKRIILLPAWRWMSK